ncbi:hypothetical protein [Flavobacterium sp.]|uniref:hypothetical protein n=1 Tax=Flavobacterium sp. TaxID=239 RepID=UPI00286E0111|nr:hypothetical protein [Flavobacterium sp.]
MILLITTLLLIWITTTIWAQAEGPEITQQFGEQTATKSALIVYDADPFFNFDQQVCTTFAKTLAEKDWLVTVATVKAAKKMNISSYNLYVFCANTYNWDPDWAIDRFIIRNGDLFEKNVVAITLGSGSTARSQKSLEILIKGKSANLIDSKSFWLLKPNDESRTKESNVKVANEMVEKWVLQLLPKIVII